jgi:hypothetical protein
MGMMCKVPVAFLFLLAACGQAAEFDHSHALFGKVLSQSARGGLVNYSALKAAPSELNSYLDQLGGVSKADFQKWNLSQQIAFLINLYNASTLKLVVDNYPLTSIKKIGGAKGPGEQPSAKLFGGKVTLNKIEHEMLRRNYPEPRIHFALSCAALGCPVLREEPYTADKLDAQLADQARTFLSNPSKNRVDLQQQTLFLSPIFKWYAADFQKNSNSVQKYISQFFPRPVQEELKKGDFKIEYTDYNWALNDSSPSKGK